MQQYSKKTTNIAVRKIDGSDDDDYDASDEKHHQSGNDDNEDNNDIDVLATLIQHDSKEVVENFCNPLSSEICPKNITIHIEKPHIDIPYHVYLNRNDAMAVGLKFPTGIERLQQRSPIPSPSKLRVTKPPQTLASFAGLKNNTTQKQNNSERGNNDNNNNNNNETDKVHFIYNQWSPGGVYDGENSARYIRGAEILCFMMAPNENRDVYLLLGKENGTEHTNGQWCGFGGSVDDEDEAVSMTAAREFVEETLNLDIIDLESLHDYQNFPCPNTPANYTSFQQQHQRDFESSHTSSDIHDMDDTRTSKYKCEESETSSVDEDRDENTDQDEDTSDTDYDHQVCMALGMDNPQHTEDIREKNESIENQQDATRLSEYEFLELFDRDTLLSRDTKQYKYDFFSHNRHHVNDTPHPQHHHHHHHGDNNDDNKNTHTSTSSMRQYNKEYMCMVCNTNDAYEIDQLLSRKIHKIQSLLESGDYLCKISICINFGAPNNAVCIQEDDDGALHTNLSRRWHVTYLKWIPWNASIVDDFEEKSNVFTRAYHASQHVEKIFEKHHYTLNLGAKIQYKTLKQHYNTHIYHKSSKEEDVLEPKHDEELIFAGFEHIPMYPNIGGDNTRDENVVVYRVSSEKIFNIFEDHDDTTPTNVLCHLSHCNDVSCEEDDKNNQKSNDTRPIALTVPKFIPVSFLRQFFSSQQCDSDSLRVRLIQTLIMSHKNTTSFLSDLCAENDNTISQCMREFQHFFLCDDQQLYRDLLVFGVPGHLMNLMDIQQQQQQQSTPPSPSCPQIQLDAYQCSKLNKLWYPFYNACDAYYNVVTQYGYGTPLVHDTLNNLYSCGYSVDEHYLEKSQIKLWSCHRLSQVLENSGNWNREQFRHSFLPILSLVLEYFLSNQDLHHTM